MEYLPSGIRPAAMEGHGAYNRSSRVQAAGATHAVSLFEKAASLADLPPPSMPIVIADFGAPQGANSLAPVAAAIHALRARAKPEQEISVVHTDLPDNDFQALFRTLTMNDASYLRIDPGTFASAVGRSFYEQVLPSDSVTLGWSSWAVQWLSSTPTNIPDQVQVAYSQDPAVRAMFAARANEDWRTFLIHRGREMGLGGRLVVLTMALTEDGDFGYQPILQAMYATLRRLVDENWLSAAALQGMAIPTVGRSLADICKPFKSGSFAGLAVEHAEVFLEEDPIWSRFQHDQDAYAFGSGWAAFSRASVLPTLARGLENDQDGARAAEFIDRIEAGMAEALAKAPQPVVIPLVVVTLVKEPQR